MRDEDRPVQELGDLIGDVTNSGECATSASVIPCTQDAPTGRYGLRRVHDPSTTCPAVSSRRIASSMTRSLFADRPVVSTSTTAHPGP